MECQNNGLLLEKTALDLKEADLHKFVLKENEISQIQRSVLSIINTKNLNSFNLGILHLKKNYIF